MDRDALRGREGSLTGPSFEREVEFGLSPSLCRSCYLPSRLVRSGWVMFGFGQGGDDGVCRWRSFARALLIVRKTL